jgi:hypothetical protein
MNLEFYADSLTRKATWEGDSQGGWPIFNLKMNDLFISQAERVYHPE